MKLLFIALIGFTSFSASACPNLSGRFLCKAFTNDKDQDITIAQSINGNVAAYKMTIVVKGENPSVRNYLADNKVRPLPRDGYTNYTNQSACVGNELQIRVKGTGTDKDHPDQDGLVIFKIDANNNIYDSYRGKWGAEKDKFFEETCRRI